jgi:hypothetical protein
MGVIGNYERIRDCSVAIVVSTIPHLSWPLGSRWPLEEPPFGISLHSSFYMGIGKFDILAPVITDWVIPITYNS